MELLIAVAIASYILYLRYFGDFSTEADKERTQLKPGIDLYNTNQLEAAWNYFNRKISEQPNLSIAYLYRARCLRELGDPDAALKDLRTAESFDNTVVETHTEIGRILYEQRNYEEAFKEFEQAVFHSRGHESMPYYWRGLARQQLGQTTESQHDLEKATALEHALGIEPAGALATGPFFDKRLLTNAVFILINCVALLYTVKNSPVIHGPYLLAAVSAAAIGFAEPRKGWFLAILQAVTIIGGYYLFTEIPTQSGKRELEAFNLFGSVGLTFVGSFIGGMLKRAMK